MIDDVKIPTDDALEQAFRQGFEKGKTEDKRIIDIVYHYGFISQCDIMIEECAELTQAICKMRRCYSSEINDNLLEEIADVFIMVRQLRVIFGMTNIDKIVEQKLDRQMQRIAEEREQK